jgi:hypothetical protein
MSGLVRSGQVSKVRSCQRKVRSVSGPAASGQGQAQRPARCWPANWPLTRPDLTPDLTDLPALTGPDLTDEIDRTRPGPDLTLTDAPDRPGLTDYTHRARPDLTDLKEDVVYVHYYNETMTRPDETRPDLTDRLT